MKNRTDVINDLIERNNYDTYLEIGFQYGISFNAVNCKHKLAIDPNPLAEGCELVCTSDEFFDIAIPHAEQYGRIDSPDIIFIDGDHSFEQSYTDFKNSLQILRDNGAIVLHDTNPYEASQATQEPHGGAWCGEVYKTIVAIRLEGMYVYTHPFDYGVTVVLPHIPAPIPNWEWDANTIDFATFDKNRNTILNIVA